MARRIRSGSLDHSELTHWSCDAGGGEVVIVLAWQLVNVTLFLIAAIAAQRALSPLRSPIVLFEVR